MSIAAIVDYGMCNLDSIARAVEECGGTAIVTDDPAGLNDATHIILPGVGSFADAMRSLSEKKLDRALEKHVIGNNIPFMGICLGMQLMASVGLEGGESAGLGWIDGQVQRLAPSGEDIRIPHIGWNEVRPRRESALFHGIAPGKDFYFVHSYHMVCRNQTDIAAETPYAGGFVSAVHRDHIFGVQFHPEKSQKAGFQLIKNFLSV